MSYARSFAGTPRERELERDNFKLKLPLDYIFASIF
jgi:hypothetical protein